jgi:DNA (cytosine-5)-methyltransferase 1
MAKSTSDPSQMVAPDDLRGFVQCHFFAGIGGWSYALRLAGWPDDRHVWTGSCPCQPWSVAGAGQGINDPRHLWPAWFRLIEVCRPATIFGEQTASEDGRYWIDLVYADLEARDYAIGAANLPAASAGAPHARARLWFVADSNGEGFDRERLLLPERRSQQAGSDVAWSGEVGPLEHADSGGAERVAGRKGRQERAPQGRREDEGRRWLQALDSGAARNVGHTNGSGLALRSVDEDGQRAIRIQGAAIGQAGATRGFWEHCDWLWHRDRVYRAVEPGAFPLASRLPGDVEQIRAFGNAIVPQVAAVFIQAYLDARSSRLPARPHR